VIVGEQGPAIFRPDVSGAIIPNGQGDGGVRSVTINYNIDARGADPGGTGGYARRFRTARHRLGPRQLCVHASTAGDRCRCPGCPESLAYPPVRSGIAPRASMCSYRDCCRNRRVAWPFGMIRRLRPA